MYDVISIGTLTIDLYFKSDTLTTTQDKFELQMGGKYFTDHFYESLGGGATNVAIGLQNLGVRASLKSIIGENSFKRMIVEKLHEHSVSYLQSKFVKEHLNISCILLSPTGEKTVINYQSPHQHLFTEEEDYRHLTRTKSVYFGNAPDVSFFEKLKVLKFLKERGVLTFLNLGVMDCRRTKEQLDDMLSNIDVLIVNTHEFADIVKHPYDRINFKENIIKKYLPMFKNNVFVITDGEKGSYGYHNDEVYYQERAKIDKIIDSTGAGDAYTAGFIAEYIKTKNVKYAMHSGARYAAKILGKIGAN